jgi:outer membrane protein assembly factor BamB
VKHFRIITLLLAILILNMSFASLSLSVEPAFSQEESGLNWAYPSYDRSNSGFNPQTVITKENVDQLQLQWIYRLPRNPYEGLFIPSPEHPDETIPMLENSEGVQANPLVINGIVYVETSFGVLTALNASTGQGIWTFEVNVTKALEEPWTQNRGIQRSITYHNGNIFIQAIDCTIYGLDAVTGKVNVDLPDTCKDIPGNEGRYYGEEAPVFYKDIAIVSGSSGFGQSRGFVRAYDLNTGKMLWQWFSSPPMKYGATLDVDWAKGNIDPYPNDWVGPHNTSLGAGAAVRTVGAVDEEHGIVYFGTGPPVARTLGVHGHPPLTDIPGPDLYSNSVVALDASTGELLWYYQIDQHDVHRQGIYASIILTDIDVGGVKTRVVMAPSFQGFVYVFDATTGKLMYNPVEVGAHVNDHNANKGIDAEKTSNQDDLTLDEAGRYMFCPGSEGGVSAPMAYAYNKIYAVAQNDCFETRKAVREGEEQPVSQWEYASAGLTQNSTVYAIDASDGGVVWQYTIPHLYWFAGVTVSGGVVYVLDQPGYLWMLDADTGGLLRSIKLDFSGDAGVSLGSDARGRMMLFIAVGTSELVVPTEGMVMAYALPEQSQTNVSEEATIPVTYVVAAATAVAVAYTVALMMLMKRRPAVNVTVESGQNL